MEKKYKELKYRAKLLSNQVYYLKNKNAELKQRIKELEKEPGQSEKNLTQKYVIAEKFENVPACHTYSISHILLFIQAVLSYSLPMRAAGRVLALFFPFLEIDLRIPCWHTGQVMDTAFWFVQTAAFQANRGRLDLDNRSYGSAGKRQVSCRFGYSSAATA